jgi:hypothetical protein
MNVNELLGKRLGQIIPKRGGTDFARRLSTQFGLDWTKQTIYDATTGRRVFRVAELIALAQASGSQIHELLDASAVGATEVEISDAKKISAAELRDLFTLPGPKAEGPLWRAFHRNREVIGELEAALAEARATDRELGPRYIEFQAAMKKIEEAESA